MSQYAVIVSESLGSGRFVVTSNCRSNIPVGTVFDRLSSERNSFKDGEVVLEETGRVMTVSLEIVAVDFWRKPFDFVPYGHHAGVVLEGPDVSILESYLVEHPIPWSVFLDTGSLDDSK
jgi:hypothetical protein